MRRGAYKWLLLLLPLLPLTSSAAEPAKAAAPVAAINLSLPVHQKKKLHPEISDPVTGDQAHIMEWAWSPQYAKRFNLPEQPDGLKDGGLWLIGIKVARQQYHDKQLYTCNIVGLLDNKLPMRTPPGEMYMIRPDYAWVSDLPGWSWGDPQTDFTPGQLAWTRTPKNEAEKKYATMGITMSYLRFYRHFKPDLAFFEIAGACGYFLDPVTHRNEIGFPGLVEGTSEADRKRSAHNKSSAIKFDLPDGLMRRIYPYIVEAEDWSSCLGHRNSGSALTTRALVTKRFANSCEPVKTLPANR